MTKEKCKECETITECNFGIYGVNLIAHFCSVDCMLKFAEERGYYPYSAKVQIKKIGK